MKLLFILFVLFTSICCYDNEIFKQISKQNLSKLKTLLNDSNKNERGPGGQTPLMNAVLTGKEKVVELLLSMNVDTTIGEKDG
jgi:ankyrin repeat protein